MIASLGSPYGLTDAEELERWRRLIPLEVQLAAHACRRAALDRATAAMLGMLEAMIARGEA